MTVELDAPIQTPVLPTRQVRLDELAEVLDAYNEVTRKLQQSHEALEAEVHRLREELASTNAQLQRSKRLSALGEMAAGIAHEIRNPLAAIQLYATMVVDDLSVTHHRPDVAVRNTLKIADAVRGLNAIVCDVLSFAREIEPAPTITTVGALLDRAVEAHRPAIDAAKVDVHCGAHLDEIELSADANLMHQALLNLIRNAVDAMSQRRPRQGGHRDIRNLIINATADDVSVTITVRDTGPGIDERAIDRIFNPFFTTRDTGTGLGLAIVHRIVDAHGGAVAVFNDGGAVFELTLPRRRPSQAPTREMEHEPAETGAPA